MCLHVKTGYNLICSEIGFIEGGTGLGANFGVRYFVEGDCSFLKSKA